MQNRGDGLLLTYQKPERTFGDDLLQQITDTMYEANKQRQSRPWDQVG
jgi:hypothetical protein